jgi:hypothetical protein
VIDKWDYTTHLFFSQWNLNTATATANKTRKRKPVNDFIAHTRMGLSIF